MTRASDPLAAERQAILATVPNCTNRVGDVRCYVFNRWAKDAQVVVCKNCQKADKLRELLAAFEMKIRMATLGAARERAVCAEGWPPLWLDKLLAEAEKALEVKP